MANFEKQKIKNSKIRNLHIARFVIHKNRNKTSIQPILNYLFNIYLFNIFSEMNGKKVIQWGGGGLWEWGNCPYSSWKCNYSIYLDIQVYYMNIQAISTLLCLLLVLDV